MASASAAFTLDAMKTAIAVLLAVLAVAACATGGYDASGGESRKKNEQRYESPPPQLG
jgi:hypothetical protein